MGFAVCVSLVFLAAYDAEARGRKKKKGMEPVISKRGKLIFEDDFSGKELEWISRKDGGEWKIFKKALVTKSVGRTDADRLWLSRVFTPVTDVVAEFRTFLPTEGYYRFSVGEGTYVVKCIPLALKPSDQRAEILPPRSEDAAPRVPIAVMPFRYNRPRWVQVMIEMIGDQMAVTIDGRTMQANHPFVAETPKRGFYIRADRSNSLPFLVDDVKVYEALPKDKEEEKGKKKRKKR